MSAGHPLTVAVRRALGRRPSDTALRYLDLLQRRLDALRALTEGASLDPDAQGLRPMDRDLARRFLRPRQGQWDDGDENLVRGWLDGWQRGDQDDRRETARALLEAASALAALHSRPQTLWFLLWEMESVLAGF